MKKGKCSVLGARCSAKARMKKGKCSVLGAQCIVGYAGGKILEAGPELTGIRFGLLVQIQGGPAPF
jgi:hypothetical protein